MGENYTSDRSRRHEFRNQPPPLGAPPAPDLPREGVDHPPGGAVEGGAGIHFAILQDDIRSALDAELHQALLVAAAPRPVDVLHPDPRPEHPVAEAAQRLPQAPMDMGTQPVGGRKSIAVQFDLHGMSPCWLWNEARIVSVKLP